MEPGRPVKVFLHFEYYVVAFGSSEERNAFIALISRISGSNCGASLWLCLSSLGTAGTGRPTGSLLLSADMVFRVSKNCFD